jgi:hypothetical protein
MYIFDDDNKIVNSEFSVDWFDGNPCIIVESSGGASKSKRSAPRNPDYNKLLTLLFRRLAAIGAKFTSVILDSSRVSEIPVSDRIVKLTEPYPADLKSYDSDELRRMIQREAARMHRAPEATTGGNTQKRIRICLDKSLTIESILNSLNGGFENADDSAYPGITDTERKTLQNARIGQGRFRSDLLEKFKRQCPLTGIKQENLLIASHIKPWNVCTNAERLNPENGILLSALADRLFDEGLISFSCHNDLLISPRLSEGDRVKCGIGKWNRFVLTEGSKNFMDYHRLIQFKST